MNELPNAVFLLVYKPPHDQNSLLLLVERDVGHLSESIPLEILILILLYQIIKDVRRNTDIIKVKDEGWPGFF